MLLLLATVPLEASAWLARGLHRHADAAASALRREGESRVGGSAWSGIGPVFRSPYLRQIALYLVLMTFASSILYSQQAHMLGQALTDRAARTALLAKMDLTVN